MAVGGFGGDGIELEGSSQTTVTGCYVGVDTTGASTRSNAGRGIVCTNATRVAIEGNVLSGNVQSGMEIAGTTDQYSLFVANRIGTDASGVSALGNGTGVTITAPLVRFGPGSPADGNVISGNVGCGVVIDGSAVAVSVVGNLIGTSALGSAPIPNGGFGVDVNAGSGHAIRSCVLSGNTAGGIRIASGVGYGCQITRCGIGTDASRTGVIGNGGPGVLVEGGNDHVIGSTTSGLGNVIAGNTTAGVLLTGSSVNCEVFGNAIGTDATGKLRLGQAGDGVRIVNGRAAVGYAVAEGRNTIAFNENAGVAIVGGGYSIVRWNAIYCNGGLGMTWVRSV